MCIIHIGITGMFFRGVLIDRVPLHRVPYICIHPSCDVVLASLLKLFDRGLDGTDIVLPADIDQLLPGRHDATTLLLVEQLIAGVAQQSTFCEHLLAAKECLDLYNFANAAPRLQAAEDSIDQ